MAGDHIRSLSPELLCQVLTNCDSLQQVISLATTCKWLYSVWTSNSSAIIPDVAPRCIPGFDEALVASRVTHLVKTAILDGRAPPRSDNIDIASFSAKVSRPTFSDIPHVMQLHNIANAVEKAYINGTVHFEDYDPCRGMEREPEFRDLPPQDDWNNQNLKEPFHRAVYRVLLAGPVIAGWYLEPFSVNNIPNILPPDMPLSLRAFLCDQLPDLPLELDEQDILYLEKHIAYDQTANCTLSATQDTIFGSLISWLMSSIREHITPEDIAWAQERWPARRPEDDPELPPRSGSLGLGDATQAEARVALREMMRMLVAYEFLANMTFRFEGRDGNEEDLDPWNILPHCPESSTTSAIILGVYQLEELRIIGHNIYASPAILESSSTRVEGGGYNMPVPADIHLVQDFIYRESGRVNRVDDAVTAPPNLQLFAYMLNRCFRLQFVGRYMFDFDKYNDYFDKLLDECAVFCQPGRQTGRQPGGRQLGWQPGSRGRGRWLELLMPTAEDPVYHFRIMS